LTIGRQRPLSTGGRRRVATQDRAYRPPACERPEVAGSRVNAREPVEQSRVTRGYADSMRNRWRGA
jgi:hypothetical protein